MKAITTLLTVCVLGLLAVGLVMLYSVAQGSMKFFSRQLIAAAIGVVGAGLLGRLAPTEWCAIVLAGVAVWVAEGLNTALELLADATHPAWHPLIGQAKDVAAGAVLLAAVGAVVIAVLVFAPRVWPF